MHLTRWGPPPTTAQPPVVLLHGWQDTADTFQFMVDEFAQDRPLAAPDWRGFGRSEWPQEGYWFPDYLADLDALLDQVSPHAPVSLIGHSMGGNIAAMYAGLRADRVRCVTSLEGFGLPRSAAAAAPAQLRKWLDQTKSVPPFKDYESLEQLTSVVSFRYPRFSEPQAAFVARAWSQPEAGRLRLVGDPRHRWVNPVRYSREDAEACWRELRAPLLLLIGQESDYRQKLGADGTDAAFRALVPHIEIEPVAGAGHMLHIERAAPVARRIEHFLRAHSS